MLEQQDQDFFRHLVEHALDVVTVISADGSIVYNSPSVETVLGYLAEDLEGANVLAYIHEDDQGRVSEAIANTLADGSSNELVEFRFRLKDGAYRYCQAIARQWKSGSKVELLVNTRDVTIQHQALTDLAASNELLSQIYNVSSNLLTVSNPEDGTILEVNDAWLKTLGYTLD
jgi:PAS domain S-box-containing protein